MYKLKPFKHSSHDKIIKLVPHNARVLDVGCASGYLASFLKLKNCHVTGVDNNPEYILEAKNYCDSVILLDITKEDLEGIYDVIILGDLIEHTPNPELVLLKLRKNLPKWGVIIVSVPNIANVYARTKIILGNFDYEDKGIFDKTHLRFFTIKTLKNLLKNTGYKVDSISFTPLPVHLKFPKANKNLLNSSSSMLHSLANLWPTLFTYQIIIKARKLE